MSDSGYRLVRTAGPAVAVPVLDAAQRRVVEHPGGPLLVLAGPGTGKTTTLVEAAVARVARGVDVGQLLLLTFSRRAAGELRDRVAARLDRTVREPVARTLHSYAFGVLRMAAIAAGEPTPRLLAAAEQDIVIRELLAEGPVGRWPVALRPALATLGFAAELRDLLMRAVERGLDGPALAALGRHRGRADWVAAGEFLAEYHGVTVLRDPGGFDPAELIQGAINALLADPDLLAAERARRRRIFVDEYQDTDPAQAELLALLADGADELVVVGDPDQSIYAFRGADESAIRDVDRRFAPAGGTVPVVALTVCRRSGPTLLAATRRIAARLPGRADHRALTPASGLAAGEVDVAVFRSAGDEAAYVAGTLRAAHLDGMSWDRMAVLVRSTAGPLGPLRRALTTAGVPLAVRSDDLPLAEQPAVAMLLAALECVQAPARLTETRAEDLLVGPLGGGDTLVLRRLRRVLHQQFPDDATPLASTLADPLGVTLLPDHVRRPAERVARSLAAGRAALASGQGVEQVLWEIWDASGLARRWARLSASAGTGGRRAAAAADRDLDAVLALFDTAARFTDRLPGAAAAEFVAHLRAQQVPEDPFTGGRDQPAAVTVLTAHAAKGLEWDLVCVAHVQEGSWPDLRRRGSLLGTEALVDAVRGLDPPAAAPAGSPPTPAPQLAEERRLFYVAATRARTRLVVTAVAGDEDQPSRLLDELDPVTGTRPVGAPVRGVHLPGVVAELRAVVCDATAPQADRVLAGEELARLATAGVSGADPDDWWGLAPLSTTAPVIPPGQPVAVSPSRVEAYLDCELRALLAQLGVRGDSAAAGIGTLVHDLTALAGDEATLDDLQRALDERWDELDLGAAWFADNERQRAGDMLDRLVRWLRDSRGELARVGVELPFDVRVGEAVLRGRVDRLERTATGELVVVDLKTGKKPRPAGELERHPQLGAYQLAVELGAFGAGGSGGARLVQLGADGPIEQRQPPLRDAADPGWVRAAVERIVTLLRGHEVHARVSKCHVCDVRTSCPLQPEGRQVTQ